MAAAQNIRFYAGMGVLAVVGAALGAFSYGEYSGYASARVALRRADSSVGSMLSGTALGAGAPPVSLTEANVAAAQADLAALQAQQAALRNAIAGEPENQIDSKFAGIANELGTQIQESVARWRREAVAKDIRMPRDEVCFGFRRYIRNVGTQPQRLYREVDRQRQIIGWLFTTLVESRSAGSQLLLESIDREPIETYPGPSAGSPDGQAFTVDTPDAATLASKPQPDEFILSGHSFRRPGLVGSLAFRIRFVGKTDTLRALLNTIQNSRKPIVVSAVEVNPPSAEALREIADAASRPLGTPVGTPTFAAPPGFGALAPVAPSASDPADKKPERPLVVKDSVSEYTVHLEYIFPVAPAAADPAGNGTK